VSRTDPSAATVRRMSEEDLLTAVLDLAGLLGVRAAHFRPAKTADGWRTAVSGDGKGFPDLVLVGRGGVLFRELKSARGVVAAEQEAWLTALAEAGQSADVWRPVDWRSGRIERELKAVARG